MLLDKVKELPIRTIIPASQRGAMVAISSLWEHDTVVITLLRRFGCKLCRHGASELSKLKPELEARGVKMVAIGLDETSMEDFIQRGFWAGELYLDTERAVYKGLLLEKKGVLSGLMSLLSGPVQEANRRAAVCQSSMMRYDNNNRQHSNNRTLPAISLATGSSLAARL